MSLALSTLTDPGRPAEFARLAELTCRAVLADMSLVALVEPDRQVFLANFRLPEPWVSLGQTPLSHSFCAHVVAMGGPLIVEDALQHPLVKKNLAIADLGVYAYLGHPIREPGGMPIGSVCAIQNHARTWSGNDIAILGLVAELVDDEIARAYRVAIA